MPTSNRLGLESSPYLRQHEANPVDWYPWGPEALERSRREDRPILLSIGYSACHWCHVMAHESFESPEIAALMNANFINIKVDREERPDLDQIYQNVAQAITRGGGWPLTVFLMPDGRPFFGGTYFPPEDRWGRPGFPRLLRSLSEAYRTDRASVEENAEKLTGFIAELERNAHPSLAPLTVETHTFLRGVEEKFLTGIDGENGGFGAAPKFPNSMMLSFLLRMGTAPSREAVRFSLVKMAKGGIFDQLGGGFHRYSVDERWAVPHFEKMLYDNGLLLQLYSEALLSDRRAPFLSPEDRALFLATIRKTSEYLLREMESPEGGFYAAQDADSEGEEGKFFVFDETDLAGYVDLVEAKVLALRFGVDAMGNFEHAKTVLYQARTEAEIAEKLEVPLLDVQALLKVAERKLLAARETRVKPGLDDKILVSWNGLAISGLAWAAHVLALASRESGNPEETVFAEKVRASAIRAFERIAKLPIPADSPYASSLPATIQRGTPKGQGFLDDYAFMARAALDLYRFGVSKLADRLPEEWAALWMDRILESFRDPSGDPGYFFTGDDHEALLQRPKSLYDQAIPSGTAVACSNLLALSEILPLGERHPVATIQKFTREANETLGKLGALLERNAYGHGELASALRLSSEGFRVFEGPRASEAISSDRDFAPERSTSKEFKVCSRGTCQLYAHLEDWAVTV